MLHNIYITFHITLRVNPSPDSPNLHSDTDLDSTISATLGPLVIITVLVTAALFIAPVSVAVAAHPAPLLATLRAETGPRGRPSEFKAITYKYV